MYGADFEFVPAKNPTEAAEIVKSLYCGYVRRLKVNGKSIMVDDVQILSPMRKRGACSTNALNKEIQSALNPASPEMPEVIVGIQHFRLGDRVMQTKNSGEVSNGDIGRICGIDIGRDEEYSVLIDFGHGRTATYGPEDMMTIELAYACTIHKSQGSEYPVVIIPILNEAGIMLQCNLIYTAITRAKEKVIIVGQKEALFRAIHRMDEAKRNTVLGRLIGN